MMVDNNLPEGLTAFDTLKVKLNAETGKLRWPELERHFARGVVIRVASELDLIEVAAHMAVDDSAAVARWRAHGQVAAPTVDEIRGWLESATQFWSVVVAPWVLIQSIDGPEC